MSRPAGWAASPATAFTTIAARRRCRRAEPRPSAHEKGAAENRGPFAWPVLQIFIAGLSDLAVADRGLGALGHELVELGLVLGGAQPGDEFAEGRLLVLQPADGLVAIGVEGRIAGAAEG